jgi:hypothetical protein
VEVRVTEQKLKKVTEADRKAIALATSTNRRATENFRREQTRRAGPAVCRWCGAEPCGALWTRPGDIEPGGERCCQHCDHEPVEGWQHTHTAWTGLQNYPVCAVPMREGDVIYLRRDGVVQFVEMHAPVRDSELGGDEEPEIPTIAFLGRDVSGLALYLNGEGGPTGIDQWSRRRDLDIAWLPIRMQAAVARDLARREKIKTEDELAAEAHARKVDAEMEAERLKREAFNARKDLQHETRIVMSELGDDDEEEAMEMPDDGSESEVLLDEPAPALGPEPARPINLKAPVPVKKGPGRPKRSARQRDARKRQKRAWVRQEAQSRIEVKRLERLARARGQTLVKEDE